MIEKQILNIIRGFSILGFILLPVLSGCSLESTNENSFSQQPGLTTSTSQIPLTPYVTSTPTLSTGDPDIKFTPTVAPSQTPTPFLYTIIKDDTLTSIAFKHGVGLKDLISSNPGIDPNFLSIGMTLTIPISGSVRTNLPAITPLPILVNAPICYSETTGGLWCLGKVENTLSIDIENINGRTDLFSSDNSHITSSDAFLPITLLPAGRKAILYSYFPPPLPEYSRAELKLTSTIPAEDIELRYIDLSIANEEILFSENHLRAQLRGEISVSNQNQTAETVWVTAFAYDNKDNPIGFRKWIFEDLLTFGEKLPFNFSINSLGSPIEKIEILYEAKP